MTRIILINCSDNTLRTSAGPPLSIYQIVSKQVNKQYVIYYHIYLTVSIERDKTIAELTQTCQTRVRGVLAANTSSGCAISTTAKTHLRNPRMEHFVTKKEK